MSLKTARRSKLVFQQTAGSGPVVRYNHIFTAHRVANNGAVVALMTAAVFIFFWCILIFIVQAHPIHDGVFIAPFGS